MLPRLDWPEKKKIIQNIQEHVAFFLVVGIITKGIQFAASFI